MGVVKDHLNALIAKEVDDHGIVVWYDDERHFADFVESISLREMSVLPYDGSFFALRQQLEAFLNEDSVGRALIYIPLSEERTHKALVEAGKLGSTLKLSLAKVANDALRPFLGPKTASEIEKQVKSGQLDLRDLDTIDTTGEITRGVVAVILGTGNVHDIALRFLTGEQHDTEIANKNASAELAMLLNNGYGAKLSAADQPPDIRFAFARYILATDFLSSLAGEIPRNLASVPIAEKPQVREACVALANDWRNRQDLRKQYAELADRVGSQLQLSDVDFAIEQVASSQTFRDVEQALCVKVTAALLERGDEELVALAQNRQSSFWSEYSPDVQAQWALIAAAGQVLVEAGQLEKQIKKADGSVSSWVRHYAEGEQPWCMLDTHHRHLERRYHNFDFDAAQDHEALSLLIASARHRYMEIGSTLSDRFLRRLRNEKFKLDVLSQSDVYQKRLRPGLSENKKTAYVWVDALRFEMGRELAKSLIENFEVTCEPAIALVPTITEIGMPALLPGEVKHVAIARDGKLALNIDDSLVRDRKERVAFLRAATDVEFIDLKLEDLLPKAKKKIEEGIRSARLILVTSQEIDALCEGDNVPFARTRMDSILHDLHRAFRVLASIGVERFVVVADHGYLFGDELDESMKVDPPRGETVDLHRRMWVGRGGESSDSFLRANLKDFGLGSDLDIATPWGFGGFKVSGGAKAFFHGGLSLQELIIPVITLTPRIRQVERVTQFSFDLIPGSKKISTRFFSVQIKGGTTGFLESEPRKIRVEVRSGDKAVSTPVSASYGFEEATADVQLRMLAEGGRDVEPNTVTLLIQEDTPRGSVSVHLLDASTGVELKKLSGIDLSISI